MRAILLNPNDAMKGGAGIQEGDYRVVNALFIASQNPPPQQGEQEKPAAKLRLYLQPLSGGQPVGEVEHEDYKAGDLEDFVPSPDGDMESSVDINGSNIGAGQLGTVGKYLIPIRSKPTVSDNCKMVLFFANLVNKCGFRLDQIKSEATFLIGLEGHFLRVAAPYKNEKFKTTVLQVEKIVKYPYDSNAVRTAVIPASGKSSNSASGSSSASNSSSSSSAQKPSSPAADIDLALKLIAAAVSSEKEKGVSSITALDLKKVAIRIAARERDVYGPPSPIVAKSVEPSVLEAAADKGIIAAFVDNELIF